MYYKPLGVFYHSFNLISGTPKEQELATLERIKEYYVEDDLKEAFILIVNYLNHLPHYKEPNSLIYSLISSMLYNYQLKRDNKAPSKDSFINYLDHLIQDVQRFQE